MKKVLNLGCGRTRLPNALGIDKYRIEDFVDLILELDITPYPFKDNSIDEIHCYHVLEHLHDPLKKLEELHRILKPGGVIYIRVPHFSSMGAFTDLTHIRPFGYYSFNSLEDGEYHHFYSKSVFKILHKEIKYLGLYPNSGIYEQYIHKNECPLLARPFIHLINYLIRLSPMAFERFWGYWVGGATEISLIMKKGR